MSALLCCFGKAEVENTGAAYNVDGDEEPPRPSAQLAASRAAEATRTAETDVFDETANNQHAAALYNRLVVQQQGSLRRSMDTNSPSGSEEPSGRVTTGRLSTSLEAKELWEKLGKMSFVDAGANGLCDRLFLGVSRVKALGSGGFASVFQARWRHVRMISPPRRFRHACLDVGNPGSWAYVRGRRLSSAWGGSTMHARPNRGATHPDSAMHSLMQVDVAVKVLVSNGHDHVDEMTKVEAQICEGLRHPNVIQVRACA